MIYILLYVDDNDDDYVKYTLQLSLRYPKPDLNPTRNPDFYPLPDPNPTRSQKVLFVMPWKGHVKMRPRNSAIPAILSNVFVFVQIANLSSKDG